MTAEQPAGETARHGKNARVKEEHVITFAEAAALFPKGRQPRTGTLLAWALHGRAAGKIRVHLEWAMKSKRKVTSIEAVRRFREATGLMLAVCAEVLVEWEAPSWF